MNNTDGKVKRSARVQSGVIFTVVLGCLLLAAKRFFAQSHGAAQLPLLALLLAPGLLNAWLSGQALFSPESIEKTTARRQIRYRDVGRFLLFGGLSLNLFLLFAPHLASSLIVRLGTRQGLQFVAVELTLTGFLLLERSGPYRYTHGKPASLAA